MARRLTWRERGLRAMFRVVLALLRLVVRLPRGALLALLDAAERLVRITTANPEAVRQIDDLRGVIRDLPPGGEALRRILVEGRDAQILSVMMGAWRHHRGGVPDPVASYAESKVVESHRREAPARIALVGEAPEFEFLREAYRGRPDCRLVDSPASADGLEIVLDGPEALALAAASLARGAAVSLHLGAATTATAWRQLTDAAARGGGLPRIYDSYFYYPPLQKLKELVTAGAIGEPTMLRIRATLGGPGAAKQLDPPFGEQPLRHPAFDRFLLLTFLGGPAASLTAYLQPMDAARGGQGLIACRFAAPGRLGLLECAYAPELYVRSDYFPHDLEIEYTGTDGFLRLRRGMAERTQEPPLIARIGKTMQVYGMETGMRDDWAVVYKNAAAEMVGLTGGRSVVHLPSAAVVSALNLRERVYDAARAARPIEIF
ncbi:MAG: hypothetical protein GX444_02415 [Myxococcales bacterium]|nr:hypothetical protein [Myxococcales bacterium]